MPVPADESKALLMKNGRRPLLGDSELAGRLSNGEAFEDIFVDHVLDHFRRPFSGHVYNLETECGYYYANGIVVHNCRTVQVPSLAADIMGERPYVRAFKPIGEVPQGQRTKNMVGQVSANTRYRDWFARQPANFQREWLGKTRYQLYKKGKYTIDRFVDPVGRQYTIPELRARDAETFREVFG